MTRRLQVLLDDEEMVEIQELARGRHQTTAAWVREALRVARDTASYPETGRKLRAVREAASHSYPAGQIDDLLEEIGSSRPNTVLGQGVANERLRTIGAAAATRPSISVPS